MRLSPLLVVAIAALPACKVKEGRAPTKVPAGISIPVTVEGASAGTIDTAWLTAHAPDFRGAEDQRAWKIAALAAAAEAPGAVIEIESDGAQVNELQTGPSAVAVVTLNKNDELVAKILDPKEPFPAFHGRGGNRGRGGEDERVKVVRAIRVKSGGSGAGRTLSIEVEGKPVAKWSDAELAALPSIAFTGRDGDPAKGWSLRELARKASGDGARIDRVTGADGPVAIDAALWSDMAKSPLLRVNARGEWKLDWATGGARAEGPEAFGVTAIHVIPGG